ncbi:MAG: hypothetical protein VB117_06125, partial [[Clostridium] scindens]|uniref:hypothetical protein n=1 Tax=Clostridium scindens (strain JCM 10418 / VPI 12708) TaxID=29347 RepID=UPI002B21668F
IKSWMIESQTRISGLERIAGVTAGCRHPALKSQGMNMATIRAVLKATGLTFEAAFGGCVAQEAHDEQS